MSKTSAPPPAPGPARRSGTRRWLPFVMVLFVVAGVVGAWLQPDVLFEGEGRFASIEVVERRDGLRELTFDGGPGRQSAIYPDQPLRLVLPYSRVMMIGPALVAPDARILFVGLGGGAMPTFVHTAQPESRIEVVEIDPLVIRVAREWFGFETDARMRVHEADGRAFIEASPLGRWALIVLDAFSEDGIPASLTTRTFLESVRRALAAGGVVVSNLHTAAPEYPAMVATYQAVFDQVVEIDVPRRRQRILVAAEGAASLDRTALVAAAERWEDQVGVDVGLPADVHAGHRIPPAGQAPVLDDAGLPDPG